MNLQKEAIGLQVLGSKLNIVSYVVDSKEAYDKIKAGILSLGFTPDKPYQNEEMGIVEETGFVKDKILVIASHRKTTQGQMRYDFTITHEF